ncbi:nucleolar protein dao-5 isoform X3 [Pseudorasbora parva]|uniref:nucleolar protein dao-5 isoform X3 n=1 Tax=Pseudorasbora parva TaxID=51549 RepID=UPI00351E45CC
MIAGMSSAENLNAHHRRNPRRTCRISDFLSELNKPVSSFKAYILHSKETTASQDLNTAESCRQRKVKKEKEKPQIVNQNALPDASPCLQKSTYELLGINGEISSNSHKPEPLVPQKMTTPKCPSKTSKRSYKGRKNKYVQPSEKEVAASKDGLDNSVYNSCSKEHLSSSKTKGTCYQDSKKTQIHQTPSYSSTGLHTCTTLSPCCHKEMSSCHTNGDCRSRPHTPKHDQLQSSPLLSSTPSSDRNPLSPKRVENSYTPPSHQKVEESSLKKSTPSEASPSKRGRGRPRGSKEMNVQEKTSASPPWKRGRKSASSPLKSHQEEQSFETQPPSRPCIENKKPEQQKLAFMEMSSCLTDGDCSSRPRTPKRDQLQSSPLLSSTPSSDLHPLSPKRVENIYTPHSHQEVEESSLIKSTPSEASPLKRGRGRPRCCKKMNVQEQSSASPPEKRGRESTTSPVKFTQEEPSFETQPPSRPCIETKEPEPQKSAIMEMSSSHTNHGCSSRPRTPKHDQLQSSPFLSSTLSSDLHPLSPKRSTPSEAPPLKRGRGRPKGSKKTNVQEQTSASPPRKLGRKSATSPVKSHQEEPSFETQPPSRPCIETKEPEQQKSAIMEMSSCHPDGDCSSRPRTPKRDQLQSSPLLSSTLSSDLHPLSPKRSTPSEASPLKRGRGRPRGSKKTNVQEQSSASPPGKRGRKSATSPVKSHQEERSFETQPPSRPCIETKEPEPQKSADQNMSSDLSIELSVLEEPHPLNHSVFMQEEEEDQDEDEEELPSFLQQDNKKPLSISEGLCVWCKLRKYPYWPAVVKSVNHKSKKASILFIDSCLIDQKRIRKGFSVPLRNLKRFDCDEYETLVDIAKEKYGSAISWSVELISDYRIRIGCGSFSGSFIEYCAADISCPVWKKYSEKKSVLTFPSQEILGEECDNSDNNTEDIVEEQDELLSKKVLPDRSKAARNRANEHLIDFIIRRKVENRLLAVISGRESSKWMQALHKPSRPVVDVYLEDEEQVDRVYRYLNKVCDSFPETNTCLENNQVDRIRLILDVLLPEAIIHAIAGVHKLSLEKAEEKYRRGPCFSNRERQEFDMMIEQQMKLKEITQHHRP